MCELTESFEVAGILVHGNFDNTAQDCKNPVLSLQAVFKFKIFVPERVSEEVQTNRGSTALKEPITECQSSFRGGAEGRSRWQGVQIREG